MQRIKQQGLGKPIISVDFKGQKFVAVGNRLYWAELNYRYMKDQFTPELTIQSTPTIGAVDAYLGLSYNLYLLAHNVELQESLIKRLKNKDQFLGVYYETFLSAAFIKAGFDIELEDETDSRISHCEFTATFKETGKKFSVEAKARKEESPTPDIGNQLYNALKKDTIHTRIVFIELNSHQRVNDKEVIEFAYENAKRIRVLEQRLTIKGNPAPEAYVFLTNYPYQLNLEATNIKVFCLAEGFKIPEFNIGHSLSNFRDVIRIRENYHEMFHLVNSIKEHHQIPSTFEGEIPELKFSESHPRLKIGNRYAIPDNTGKEVIGELVEATATLDGTAIGVYRLEDGRNIIAKCPLTKEELIAYQKYPDTFFGAYRKQGRKVDTPIDLFDFFYDTYKHTEKEKLLEFMRDHADIKQLQNYDQKELAIIFCERSVHAAMKKPTIQNLQAKK